MKSKSAFTLVELMLVVGIIALLVALAVPNVLRARIDANDANAKTTLKAISSALENYYAQNSQYPSATTTLLGTSPPYLNTDYFSGNHNGFSYTAVLTNYTYSIVATPVSSTQGSSTFTINTGGVLQ